MGIKNSFWYYFWQFLYVIPIAVTLHYCQLTYFNKQNQRYNPDTDLDLTEPPDYHYKQLVYELLHLRKELFHIRKDIEELRTWRVDMDENIDEKLSAGFDIFYSDQIGVYDYASEYAGGFIISTPDTLPYPTKFGLRLFGVFDLAVHSQPNVILQHSTYPGKCFAFYGDKGRIRIKLSRPIIITHITLEHLRLGDDTRGAPKDFQVLGFGETGEELLGDFIYDMKHSVIQTFRVLSKNQTFHSVELRILSNYMNNEFTCIYRFRVHSVNLK